jgi:hypothetical protein
MPRWGLSVDRLPPLTHVLQFIHHRSPLGSILFYSILFYSILGHMPPRGFSNFIFFCITCPSRLGRHTSPRCLSTPSCSRCSWSRRGRSEPPRARPQARPTRCAPRTAHARAAGDERAWVAGDSALSGGADERTAAGGARPLAFQCPLAFHQCPAARPAAPRQTQLLLQHLRDACQEDRLRGERR